jgi:coenzyme Q-binding protein COQ10
MPATTLRGCVRHARLRSAVERFRRPMPQFHTVHHIDHSASNMFALVADVERYPEFVPLCSALRVKERNTGDDGVEILLADMTVSYKLLQETFTSRVTLDPAHHKVDVEYVDGPFKHLVNRWRFKETSPSSCDVDFYVSYEFASRSLQFLVGAVFDKAFRKFVDAFEARADQFYGRGGVESDRVAGA